MAAVLPVDIFGTLTWTQVLQVLLIGVIVSGVVQRFLKGKALNLPPGPRPWPVVGNLPHLGPQPHKTVAELTKKYGPIVYMRMGSVPTVITSHPKIVGEIMKEQDHVFSSRPSTIASRVLTYDSHDFAMAPYGAHWRHMRRVCVNELLTPKRLETFEPIRNAETDQMLKNVLKKYEAGKSVEIRHEMEAFSMNIMTSMILGKRYFGDASAGQDDSMDVLKLLTKSFDFFGVFNIGDFIPALKWFDLQGYQKPLKQVHDELDEKLQTIIEQHRQQKGKKDVHDFIDVLLSLPGEEGAAQLEDATIKALTLNMMWSGTDTPVTTTEWALAELVRHPEIQEKLQQEIDAVVGHDRPVAEADFYKLPYLKCVVKETFRLHPPGPFGVPRQSMIATKVAGYDIPANTNILISILELGRNPEVWSAPLEFQPERWSSENLASINDPELRIIPFGLGRRGCPGGNLGQTMVMLAVARLVHNFNWSPEPSKSSADISMEEKFGGTMPMLYPLRAFATPRNPIH